MVERLSVLDKLDLPTAIRKIVEQEQEIDRLVPLAEKAVGTATALVLSAQTCSSSANVMLRRQVAELRRQLTIARDAATERNRQLDALHLVWCTGGCGTGHEPRVPRGRERKIGLPTGGTSIPTWPAPLPAAKLDRERA